MGTAVTSKKDTKKYIKDFSIYGFSLLIILIVFAIFI